MTIKQLIEKLKDLPQDSRVNINIALKINGSNGELSRDVDNINYCAKEDVVSLNSNWPIQIFY